MMLWLTFLAFVGFFLLSGIWLVAKRRTKQSKRFEPFDFGKTSSQWTVRTNEYTQKAYTKSSQIPLIKGLVRKIRTRIETLSIYDEYTLRKEVMRIVFSIGALILSILVLILLIRPGWVITFWIFLGVVFLSGVLLDFFVYRVGAKLLVQLKEFNNRIRYYYQQTKMVDEAVFESIQHVGPEMRIQADRIHRILTSVDPDAELIKYEEVAPSRFLKLIAGLAVLVKDQGDIIDERGSAFLRGLTSVNQELNAEILYRSKLSYRLRSLSVLALIPIFFALPIQNWAIGTFPMMKLFYESRIGFLSEVIVYGISVAAYLLVRKMRQINEAKYIATNKRMKWEEWTLTKIPFMQVVVSAFTPASFTKEYFKLSKLLKDANSQLKIEWLTLHRMVFTLSAVLLLVSGLWYAHVRQANSVINTIGPDSLFAGNVSEADMKIYKETNSFDKRILEDMRAKVELTPEKLQIYVAQQLGIEDVNDLKVKQSTNRIVEKWTIVNDSFLKWWEVLIAIFFGAIMWFVPVWFLMFQRRLRYKDMENEVYQYLVVISILREFDRMSVYVLLTWLERFGVVFKEPIQASLQVYDAGPEEALDQLGERVSFEPFNQIVERLKLAIMRISIKESFDDIEMEREFYLEQRKEANERSLEEKSTLGSFLGLLPMVALIFIYLVGPLLYLSVVESNELFSFIKK